MTPTASKHPPTLKLRKSGRIVHYTFTFHVKLWKISQLKLILDYEIKCADKFIKENLVSILRIIDVFSFSLTNESKTKPNKRNFHPFCTEIISFKFKAKFGYYSYSLQISLHVFEFPYINLITVFIFNNEISF